MAHVAIAAAGSGGHVFPALAVADALCELGVERDAVVFFGGDRMEATTVPEAGYPFVAFDLHGLRRRLSIDNLRLPALIRRARTGMISEIEARAVDVVAVFGGYVSGPAALAAHATHRPLVVHEANAVPGVANRLIARRADTVFTSFETAAARLPNAEVIGSPLRDAFVHFERDSLRPAALARYRVDPRRSVLGVVGGSLGAQFLNEVTERLARDPDRDYTIVHVTGPTHAAGLAASSAGMSDWVTVPFETSMPDLYAAADLVLSRGGAMTVAEIQATRTPAVIVPLPAGKAYQTLNAADLAAAGGAVVVDQTTVEDVAAAVSDLMGDPGRRSRMRRADHRVDHREAARTMASRILEFSDA